MTEHTETAWLSRIREPRICYRVQSAFSPTVGAQGMSAKFLSRLEAEAYMRALHKRGFRARVIRETTTFQICDTTL